LFINDEPGVWFEANDATTLFTDVAGTTPVTTPGDAVALQLDKSQGLTLGPELVTNGDFATASDWMLDSGFSIGSGVLSYDGSDAGINGRASQVITTVVGEQYVVQLDCNSIAGGSFNIRVDSGATTQSTYTTTGNKSLTFTAGSASTTVRIQQNTNSNAIEWDNISVRELPGNHRTQATTAARPLYALHPVGGVRNLLEYTEEFDNAVWQKSNAGVGSVPVVTPNAGTAPNGTETADRLQLDLNGGASTSDACYLQQQFAGAIGEDFTVKIWAKSFDGGTYDVLINISGVSIAVATVTSEWQLIETSWLSTVSNPSLRFGLRGARGTSDTADLLIWGAQAEEGSTATNYQRVGSFLDVSEEGKARRGRIWYNGTSHFMQTPTITPGTDKVQVFAGVRKLSDVTLGTVVELSDSIATNNGSFVLFVPGVASDKVRFNSKGTIAVAADASLSGSGEQSAIVAALSDISAPSNVARANAVAGTISTADQGTGSYLAYPLYFGARGGAALFFNGYEDTSIVRFGPNLDETTISKVESYVASKTPASELLIPAGPELVTNGTFDTDSDWTLSGPASISSGLLSFDGVDATFTSATQSLTALTAGENYQLSFTIKNYVSGGLDVDWSGAGANVIFNNQQGNGDYSAVFLALGGETSLRLSRDFGAGIPVFDIDNISVRQFIPK
jgi:hypothetical protein